MACLDASTAVLKILAPISPSTSVNDIMAHGLWVIVHFLSIVGFSQGQSSGCEAAELMSLVTFSSKGLSCIDVSFSSPGSTSGKF